MVTLRSLTKQQAHQVELIFPKIVTIWPYEGETNEAIEYTQKWASSTNEVEKSGEIFLILLTDSIIGITGYLIDKENNARLRWFGIVPEHRGNGYATESLTLLEQIIAKNTKYKTVEWIIETMPKGDKLIWKFFKKNRFEKFEDPHADEFLHAVKAESVRKKIERESP